MRRYLTSWHDRIADRQASPRHQGSQAVELQVSSESDAQHGAVSAKQHWYVKNNDIKLESEWDEFFEREGGQMSHSHEVER